MNPWLAVALVVVATVLSDLLIVWIHRRETNHALSRRMIGVLSLWFLVTFGVMAFLVIPH